MRKYNLSVICKRANELTKAGSDRSAAFTTAWAEAKAEPQSIATKAREFREIQKMIDELQAKANAVKKSIIVDMGGAEVIEADIFTIRYQTIISNRLDTATFKKEHNDLYSEYLKESTAKRFTVA
jgi:predicted phage-related endonuclease